MERDGLSNRVIGASLEVQRELGHGLPESASEQCLAHAFKLNGIACRLQHPRPLCRKGIRLDCVGRIDIFVMKALLGGGTP